MTFRFNDPENQELAAQLQDLRAQVDRLDHDLLDLMSQRLKLSHRLGTLKKNTTCPSCNPNVGNKFWKPVKGRVRPWGSNFHFSINGCN